jgi:hypothetical protein
VYGERDRGSARVRSDQAAAGKFSEKPPEQAFADGRKNQAILYQRHVTADRAVEVVQVLLRAPPG